MKLSQQKGLLTTNIRTNQASLWKPPSQINFQRKNEWIRSYDNVTCDPYTTTLKTANVTNEVIACKRIELHLTEIQKTILRRWMMAYVKMYNEGLHYIKKQFREKETITLNFKKLRTYHLKAARDQIQQNSYVEEYGTHTHIKTHMLDGAIKLVCSMYKSALTNYKKGNIKHFRLRYLRKKRFYRLDIEQQYIKENGICPSILEPMIATYDGEPFEWSSITSDSQLQYDSELENYYLLVPERRPTKKIDKRKSWISLDPGARTFLTGYSNEEVVEIGSRIDERIKRLQTKLQAIEKNFKKKKRKKKRRRCARKIENIIKDLHWKSIQYLVSNYDHILIGNMSTKSVVKGNLPASVKNVMIALSHFTFRERLQYKAMQHHVTVHVVNEAYTTKMCSCCTWLNEDIGSLKVFHCQQCNNVMDRDVDAARCIAFAGLF
jgi:transposase